MTPMMVAGVTLDPVLPGGVKTVGPSVDSITGTSRLVVIYAIGSIWYGCVLSQEVHNLTL